MKYADNNHLFIASPKVLVKNEFEIRNKTMRYK